MTRPGIQTTEFYLALGVAVLGGIATIYADSPIAQVGGIVAAAMASAGYGFTRMNVKRTEVAAEAGAAERADVLAARSLER